MPQPHLLDGPIPHSERGLLYHIVSCNAEIERGAEVLVPLAGNGGGMMAFMGLACEAVVDCFDERDDHHRWLAQHPFRAVVNGSVTQLRPKGSYDRVLCYAADLSNSMLGTELSCALDALRPGGRLLAVLPASVLNADHDASLRSIMTQVSHLGWMSRIPTTRLAIGEENEMILITIHVSEVGHG